MIDAAIDPGEEELLRLVDHQLGAEERVRVLERVAADPALAARIAADEKVKAEIAAMFDPVMDEPVPARLVDAVQPQSVRRGGLPPLYQALAAALLVAIGLAGGWYGRGLMPQDTIPPASMANLAGEAAIAHKVYVVEVRHPVEVPASEEAHLFQWLSRRLGTNVKAPPLNDLGFALVGGRLLPNQAGPAAQFMYEASSGERVTLYVASNQANQETAFRFESRDDASVFYWIDGTIGYALIGGVPRDRLLPLARAVYERLGS